MPVSSVFAFWGVALLLIMVPGADWAFTLGAGLRGRSVVPAVGGLVLGYAAITLVVAAGLGAFVAENPKALTVLTVLGGGYLIWHGVRTFAAPSVPDVAASDVIVDGVVEARGKTGWATLAQGIGVSGLNPKGLLIFIALLPQFTRPDRSWPLAVQMTALGLVFTVTCAAFYLALGSVARTFLLSRPAAARVLSRVSGVGMVIVGISLISDRLSGGAVL
ncbi:LysE family translocator [Microtetraspora malaysiensis]|uniref:LysE family translocator n=1 Tax=Microtetraspora malaysiensis TaxID=161358 RepID=UPI000829633A|nr:LysE family translocator [Microtetraspora malaysiensis]